MPRWGRFLAVIAAGVVSVAAVTFLVEQANGALSGDYALSGMFTKAGTGLHPGSEVTYEGVQVGRVTTITLVDSQAQVAMDIQPDFKVPSDATATIRPLNVFGADQVSLAYARGDATAPLGPGATITHTAVSDEIGDLFAAADPLLKTIDANDLSTIVSNLAQASDGEGPTVAASIQEGAKLADLLDRTLPQQLGTLDAFNGFTAALAPVGTSLDSLSTAENQALPSFNANAGQYAELLKTLTPFANDLAGFLAAYHPQIQTLLASGDNVARVLLARQQDVGQVISGAGVYLTKFANAINPNETLPDGSHFAYFHTFVMFADLNSLICGLLAPATPGLSFLVPLQEALSGAGTPLDCSSQIAAFNAAQGSGTPGPSSVNQAAQSLSNAAYQQIGQPQQSPTTGLGGLLGSLLGGSGGGLLP
ncbi:MAG TPA: MCE family protein [Acidimicrobiales bacterium]|nr:MCE family protein [Acidimicrobiales bacterium]